MFWLSDFLTFSEIDEDWDPTHYFFPGDSAEGSDTDLSPTVPVPQCSQPAVFTTPPGVVIPPSVKISSPRGDIATDVTSGSLTAKRKAEILLLMRF